MKNTNRHKATVASALLAILLITAVPVAPSQARAGENTEQALSSLELARRKVQENDFDGAARDFADHNRTSQSNRESLLQQGQVEAWRGNYSKAMELLDLYRDKFGQDADYLRNRVRLLAWADLPDQAMPIVEELLQKDPADFSARFSKALALRKNNQPTEALALAEELRRDHPSPDTDNLYRETWTPVRSHIGASFSYYSDEDEIHHRHSELFGVYFLSPVTSLGVRLEDDYLTAPEGSGLENIDGSKDEEHRQGALELWHRFTPWLAGAAALGASRTGDLDQVPTSRLNITLNPADTFGLSISEDCGYYLISPRAISLDVRRTHYQAEANWRPSLDYTVVAQVAYDKFSDGNHKWLAILAPRRSLLRSQHFNLDLGLRAWQFGFDRDLDHGYYDPDKYQSYMATAFVYWKINRENEAGLVTAAGMLKDNTMDKFEFGWDATLSGFFGIYRDWLLKVHLSTMVNQRQNAGIYNASSGGLSLIRRF